jgi:CRISPR system Cascade subunit CasD
MRAIALRLEGPMQSWGGPVAGDDRPTLAFPTKSGVLGLLGGALGLSRDDTAPLVALHAGAAYGVRVERPGSRGVDFHTAQDVPRKERGQPFPTVVSRRGYLYDATFTALVAERGVASVPLDRLLEAVRWPTFSPYLGRRSCPPSAPLLASPPIVEGGSWLELFAAVPLSTRATRHELFVEPPAPDSYIRELRVRDSLVGPLARLFGDTQLFHVRLPLDEPGDHDNTVDPWFDR